MFSPFCYAGNFSTTVLLILCAFKSYVECLYRHIFLEDTCTNIKVTKKNLHVQRYTVIAHVCMDSKTPYLHLSIYLSLYLLFMYLSIYLSLSISIYILYFYLFYLHLSISLSNIYWVQSFVVNLCNFQLPA